MIFYRIAGAATKLVIIRMFAAKPRGTSGLAKTIEVPSLAAQPRLQWQPKQPNIEQHTSTSSTTVPADPKLERSSPALTVAKHNPVTAEAGVVANIAKSTTIVVVQNMEASSAAAYSAAVLPMSQVGVPTDAMVSSITHSEAEKQFNLLKPRFDDPNVVTPSTVQQASVPTAVIVTHLTSPIPVGRSNSEAILAANLPAAPPASTKGELLAQPHADIRAVTEYAAAGTSFLT